MCVCDFKQSGICTGTPHLLRSQVVSLRSPCDIHDLLAFVECFFLAVTGICLAKWAQNFAYSLSDLQHWTTFFFCCIFFCYIFRNRPCSSRQKAVYSFSSFSLISIKQIMNMLKRAMFIVKNNIFLQPARNFLTI